MSGDRPAIRKPPVRLTEPDLRQHARDEAKRLYLGGLTIREAAAELDISYSTARRLLYEASVPMRPTGPPATLLAQTRPQAEPVARRVRPRPARVISLYRQGLSMRKIATRLNISYYHARQLLVDGGLLQPRPDVPERVPGARACLVDPTVRRLAMQEAALLYRGGLTTRQVAAQLNVSYSTAHSLLHEASVPMRPRGGPGRRTR